jgi:2,4-dienoyl-CoA reductase (NADPH2)
LTEGRADWIGIGRQLIADPQWPLKVSEGRSQEIVACKSCNTCLQPMLGIPRKFGDPICKVNPEAGREVDLA